MRRYVLALVFSIVIGVLAVPIGTTPARAQQGDAGAQVEECLRQARDAGRDMTFGPPGCSFRDGEFVGFTDDASGSSSRSFSGFVVFVIVLGVFWSLIPFAIACVVAANRNESVGMAVLLTLVLGWIGLAIVLTGQKKVGTAAGRLLTPAQPESDRSAAERLRELEGLRSGGLVTDAEYADRRRSILADV